MDGERRKASSALRQFRYEWRERSRAAGDCQGTVMIATRCVRAVLAAFALCGWACVASAQASLEPEMAPEPADGGAPVCQPTFGLLAFNPGQGVTFESCDGDYELHMWPRVQLRYTYNGSSARDGGAEQVFEVRRAGLFFAGHAFGEHNKYFLQFVFAPRDVGLGASPASPLFDVFLTFDYLRDLSLRVGQYKPFYSRQFIDAWGDLQFVDRSIVQNEFHLERDLGLDLFSSDLGGLGLFRYYAGVYLGQGRNSVAPRSPHFSPVVRLEVLPFGTFADYREGDLDRSSQPRLSIGVAYAYLSGVSRTQGVHGDVPADGGTSNLHSAMADFMFKWHGASLTGEGFFRRGVRERGDAVDDGGVRLPTEAARNGAGYFLQAGYLLPAVPVEIAVRGGQVIAPGVRTSLAEAGELGGALSYYFSGHPFKLQLDYFRTARGAQTLAQGTDQVRAQLQMQM